MVRDSAGVRIVEYAGTRVARALKLDEQPVYAHGGHAGDRSEARRGAGMPLFRYYGAVGAAGGEFVHGRSDTPELVWRRPDGTARQIMRWQPDEHGWASSSPRKDSASSMSPEAACWGW